MANYLVPVCCFCGGEWTAGGGNLPFCETCWYEYWITQGHWEELGDDDAQTSV
jgi:hypothetical protein